MKALKLSVYTIAAITGTLIGCFTQPFIVAACVASLLVVIAYLCAYINGRSK